ncbi:MAG TPA: M28 family peptidase [Bacteroidota bacterium]|nr:M28 family peptidase [Bacteroidota bacterium]
MRLFPVPLLLVGVRLLAPAQEADTAGEAAARRLRDEGLTRLGAYEMLRELAQRAPHRLSGSTGADSAVALAQAWMHAREFSNVHLERVTVPHWVRGKVEKAFVSSAGRPRQPIAVCALGGSIATPPGGITAPVVEVRSFADLQSLGAGAAGKIVFYNRAMDPRLLNTFQAYEGAVDQRSRGAIEGAKAGAVAVLVRSMTLAIDGVPHTGAMGYMEGVRKIPAAAVSTRDAEMLSGLIARGARPRVTLVLSSKTLPDAPSANVVGEITGDEAPQEVVVIGGHIDAWDKGTGAHDDGAGCVQAIEALDLIRSLGLRPRKTIRAVMFMNEENGLRGGRAYPVDPLRGGERPVAMIESDAGGFAPRGFYVEADSTVRSRIARWQGLLDMAGAGRFIPGRGAVDISPMVAKGVPGFSLDPENQRYFDYHHSDKDTPDKVNPRELELGAVAEALLAWLISEEGF